ncbi:MAG: hypothetical protein ABIA62_00800 [Candidatus Woesearchaeota archaeon]
MLFKSRKKNNIPDCDLNVIQTTLSSFKDELEDHFNTLNDNTTEIDIQNNFICEIDNRITKMEEKVDSLHFLLKQLVTRSSLAVDLSKDEQRVFLILYTHDKFMRSDAVSQRSLLSNGVTEEVLIAMMDKGIPIDREIIDGTSYFRMNSEFKLKQAKEHVIKIDVDVTSQYQNALLEKFFTE